MTAGVGLESAPLDYLHSPRYLGFAGRAVPAFVDLTTKLARESKGRQGKAVKESSNSDARRRPLQREQREAAT